jgi:hypothetical protein
MRETTRGIHQRRIADSLRLGLHFGDLLRYAQKILIMRGSPAIPAVSLPALRIGTAAARAEPARAATAAAPYRSADSGGDSVAFVLARLIPATAPGAIAGHSDSRRRGAFAVRRGEHPGGIRGRRRPDINWRAETGSRRIRQAGQSDAGGRELVGGGAGRVGDAMQEAGDDR